MKKTIIIGILVILVLIIGEIMMFGNNKEKSFQKVPDTGGKSLNARNNESE